MNNLVGNYNDTMNSNAIVFHPIFDKQYEEAQVIKAPYGIYNVEVAKIEIQETSQGEPMLSIWFKVMDGAFENSIISYNKLLTRGFWIYEACELVRGFGTGIEISFKEFEQFSRLMNEVMQVTTEEQIKLSLYYYNEEENDKYEIV